MWLKYLLLLVIILGPLAHIIIFPSSPANDLMLKWVTSWPFFILIGIFLFYEEVARKIRDLLKLEGPGLKTEFTQPKDIEEKDTKKLKEIKKDLFVKTKEVVKTEDKTEVAEAKEKMPSFDVDFLLKIQFFERTMRYMFRSQFGLLKYLNAVVTWPKALCYELFYHRQYLKKYNGSPEYTFDQYFSWLADVINFVEEVVVDKKRLLQLTKRGKDFLLFCGINRYTEQEFAPR